MRRWVNGAGDWKQKNPPGGVVTIEDYFCIVPIDEAKDLLYSRFFSTNYEMDQEAISISTSKSEYGIGPHS